MVELEFKLGQPGRKPKEGNAVSEGVGYLWESSLKDDIWAEDLNNQNKAVAGHEPHAVLGTGNVSFFSPTRAIAGRS